MPVRLESDRELLERYTTGDESAFEVLYRRYRRRLWGMARRMGTDLQQAEDILVEALAAVAIQARRGAIHGSFIGYALTAVHHRGLHVLERRNERWSRSIQPLSLAMTASGPSPEDAVVNSHVRSEVAEALSELPEEVSTAVYLVDCQGLTYREAAESMSCSEATIKRRLRTARRDLALRLAHLRPSDRVREEDRGL
jgi:RNA polymerase sigma-70 factor (ECF subfamily)